MFTNTKGDPTAMTDIASSAPLTLTEPPSVKVGVLVRAEPERVFQAIVDPAITTNFWYTKSDGKMAPGRELCWTWEMYGVSSTVNVMEVVENRRVLFTWSGYNPEHPSTVEFMLTPFEGFAYLQVTERDFTGNGDELVRYVADSTGGFTFLISAIKAFLEHDVVLRVVLDAHPSGLEL
jgi:uncharacterized protein YndB with AHSA1/START domain